jgi:hypothetical protein
MGDETCIGRGEYTRQQGPRTAWHARGHYRYYQPDSGLPASREREFRARRPRDAHATSTLRPQRHWAKGGSGILGLGSPNYG